MPYLIYVLHCTGDTLYTGITPDLRRRMRQHCGQLAGGAKYTRSHPPEELLQVWSTETRTAAARFEYAFKQLPLQPEAAASGITEQWQTVLPELAEETYLPAEHLPLQSYLSRS